MKARDQYIIKGGEEGKRRLQVLADVLKPSTQLLLESTGELRGKRFLDVGSGGGHVSLLASEMVGEQGLVTAIDFDQEIVSLAAKDAQELGIANVTFRSMDASAMEYENEFDIAYSRFLLSHLQQPQVVLSKMARSVKSGGRVIVEDIDFSGHFCYPPSKAFDTYLDYFTTASLNNGQNPNIGLMLFSIFKDEPMLEGVKFDVIQPCHNEGAGKWMAYNTMDKIKETLLKQELANQADVQRVLDELKQFTEDERSVISLPRIFRVYGMKR
jgi:2-polyprenyl-3-methyl-5-hydroxy-6-metoxy-1,4-benzoquinol methylase